MKVNSNIQAQIANNVLKSNEERYRKSTEKLSSGYKINRAADSPAGMAITNKMNAQIKSLKKARANTSNGINVVQTADGALNEVHEMLQRMNVLAIKAANGTVSDSDREEIQAEINALRKEVNRVAADTEYNTQNLLGGEQEMRGYTNNAELKVLNYGEDFPAGKYQLNVGAEEIKVWDETTSTWEDVPNFKSIKVKEETDDDGNFLEARVTVTLRDGSDINFSYTEDYDKSAVEIDVTGIGGMKIQVGSSTGKEIRVVIPKMDTVNMGIDKIDLRSKEGATEAIDSISAAIEYVSKSRAKLGAYQNRLESTETSLDEAIEDLTESYSTIKDVDMAEEMVNYTTLQVLVQAGTSMLTQANEQPQQALQLLQ